MGGSPKGGGGLYVDFSKQAILSLQTGSGEGAGGVRKVSPHCPSLAPETSKGLGWGGRPGERLSAGEPRGKRYPTARSRKTTAGTASEFPQKQTRSVWEERLPGMPDSPQEEARSGDFNVCTAPQASPARKMD